MQQEENIIWQLFARSLSGEATREEINLLNSHLQHDTSLQQQYDILKHFWHASDTPGNGETDNRKKIARIFDKAEKASASDNIFRLKRRKRISRKTVAVSFSSAAFIIAAIVFFRADKIKNNAVPITTAAKKSYQIITENGNRTHTILPDGSQVWLNAGSVLTYKNFSLNTRQVYLKGEAFFDVVKDPLHPFIVHANSIDIKVLGTAFNVKSYTDDNKVEATLIRGMIQVTQPEKENDKPVFMHPNEKLVIDLTQNQLPDKIKQGHASTEPAFTLYHLDSLHKTRDMIETSWIYNKLEFRGEKFEELAKKLERWYNIQIIFEDDAVKKLSFNGSFENETVQQAFEALKVAVSFDYTINGNEVFISSAE